MLQANSFVGNVTVVVTAGLSAWFEREARVTLLIKTPFDFYPDIAPPADLGDAARGARPVLRFYQLPAVLQQSRYNSQQCLSTAAGRPWDDSSSGMTSAGCL
jgi:hypothetical protein